MNTKSYKRFYEDVREHLINDLEKSQRGNTEGIVPGIWPNNGKKYRHILNIEKGKVSAIQRYNLIRSARQLPFILDENNLHRFSHHLNSSQIMCYNFFRPQISSDKLIKKPLLKLLRDKGVILKGGLESAEAVFEYEDLESKEPNRKTNFDFFVRIGEIKVYFEIKYTENGFGVCNNDKKHQKKFRDYYEGEMTRCGIFKSEIIKWSDSFCKYYQLIRNAINVGEKSFVIIITDERNRSTNKQLCDFEKDMLVNAKYRNHLICVTWKNLCDRAQDCGFDVSHLSEFREKYLSE